MKFLLDLNISPKVELFLAQHGHDVLHARSVKPGRTTDEELLALSIQQQRILVTFDLDFGDIRLLHARQSPGVMIFRTKSFTSRTVVRLLDDLFSRHAPEQLEQQLIVMTEHQMRFRSIRDFPS